MRENNSSKLDFSKKLSFDSYRYVLFMSAKVSEKKILRASRAKAFITAAPPMIMRIGR
jgi:hypothetical protein